MAQAQGGLLGFLQGLARQRPWLSPWESCQRKLTERAKIVSTDHAGPDAESFVRGDVGIAPYEHATTFLQNP